MDKNESDKWPEGWRDWPEERARRARRLGWLRDEEERRRHPAPVLPAMRPLAGDAYDPETGLPPGFSVIDRPSVATAPSRCEVCGTAIAQPREGRTRRTCSDACRAKLSRRRARGSN